MWCARLFFATPWPSRRDGHSLSPFCSRDISFSFFFIFFRVSEWAIKALSQSVVAMTVRERWASVCGHGLEILDKLTEAVVMICSDDSIMIVMIIIILLMASEVLIRILLLPCSSPSHEWQHMSWQKDGYFCEHFTLRHPTTSTCRVVCHLQASL